jgi:hypothetical protein
MGVTAGAASLYWMDGGCGRTADLPSVTHAAELVSSSEPTAHGDQVGA